MLYFARWLTCTCNLSIDKKVKKQELTLELVANLIKHVDPKQAEEYWKQRQQIADDWDFEDD